MKSKINVLLVLAILLFIALGCGSLQKAVTGGDKSSPQPITNSDTNKSLTDKAIEDVADGESTGVQECDDLLKLISDYSKKPDDSVVTKTIKDYALGQVKKSLRESIEQNKNDKVKMAAQCTEFRKSFEKSIKEE